MKKLIWVPTVCFGLVLSACGTNNDGLQNYASNDYKSTRTNPYRNMNMYSNGGADIYRTHVNTLRPETGADFGDQRTYLLRSGTDISNNQAIHQWRAAQNNNATNWGGASNGNGIVGINRYGVMNGGGGTADDWYTGYGTSSYGNNLRSQRLDIFGGNNNSGVRGFSNGNNMSSSKIGFAQATKGQSITSVNQVYVNRDLMASYVANLVKGIPYVNRATVLVTDDHVFINVDSRQKNRGQGKQYLTYLQNQVRKQALSVTPRHYKIRVSTDDTNEQKLMELGQKRETSTDRVESMLNSQNVKQTR